jgi:hypothetical protein
MFPYLAQSRPIIQTTILNISRKEVVHSEATEVVDFIIC